MEEKNSRGDSYRVLLEGGEGEYVEKKSRFIATLRRCGSEQEALEFIEEIRKKYAGFGGRGDSRKEEENGKD